MHVAEHREAAYPSPLMMNRVLAFASLMLLAACGGNVAVDGAGGSSGTLTTTTGVGGSTASSSTTTVGAGGGCGGAATIEVSMDNGAPVTLTSLCSPNWNPSNSTQPIGYIFAGGPAPGLEGLVVTGCAGDTPEAIQLSVSNVMAPGMFTTGSVQYTSPAGSPLAGVSPFAVDLTAFGAIGEPVVGTFTATVSESPSDGDPHLLSGSFQVCHVQDEDAP
jgi:hypothetical protein